MGTLTITTRKTRSGPRYVVRYRLGGRGWPVVHAGSFKTLKEAKARRDLLAGELAAGRNPAEMLRPVKTAPTQRTLAEWANAWLASRIDLDPTSRRAYRSHLAAILTDTLAGREAVSLRESDIREWVASQTRRGLSASSVRSYVVTFRQILDFAEANPNPARSRKVKLPKVEREEPNPPTAEHLAAILARVSPLTATFLAALEQGCTRISETLAVTWGDVDVAGSRVRLRARETKRSRARFAELPPWLTGVLADLCPPEDRTPERRVFQGLTVNAVRNAMRRACTAAQIPHYHPHDLRHRRATIWHHRGMPSRELAERGGWTKASLPLDVYTAAMPVLEVDAAELEQLVRRGNRA
jgi:integrase